MKYLKKYEAVNINWVADDVTKASALIESCFQYVSDDGYEVDILTTDVKSTPVGILKMVGQRLPNSRGVSSDTPLPIIKVTIGTSINAELSFYTDRVESMFELTDELIKDIGFAINTLSKDNINAHLGIVQQLTYPTTFIGDDNYDYSKSLTSKETMDWLSRCKNNNVMGFEGKIGFIEIWFHVPVN